MIKLEEICGYLPYKLNCIIEGDDEHIHTIVGFEDSLWGILLISDKGDFGRCRYDLIKPILRNLSDLTREIEHNGEKFVPIVELAKISFPHSSNFGEWEYVELDELEKMHILQIQYKSKSNDISPYTQYCIPAEAQKMSYRNVQKLLEWHFDVFSLIDRNLAIDINTLNE